MWLTRLFGNRKVQEEEKVQEEDEPARFAPPQPIQPVKRAPTTSPKRDMHSGKVANKAVAGGFDPYNSGSFERSNAWERVKRR